MKANLTITTGEYTNKDGVKKYNSMQVGRIVEKKDGGHFIKLDPVLTNFLKTLFGPGYEGFINVWQEQDEQQTKEVSGPPPMDDDLPFR